jgi:hypothetical protein
MKAFPTPTFSINNEARVTAVGGEGGMDLRHYAAIHLRLPDSGLDWLDEMIRKANLIHANNVDTTKSK